MSNRYIFMTDGIVNIGGVELYIKEKIKWLLNAGFEVHVFSHTFFDGEYRVKDLYAYRNENFSQLSYEPFECGKINTLMFLSKIQRKIGKNRNYEKTIIESHSGIMAIWGELLSQKLNCKHVFVPIHEAFNGKSYELKKDYFIKKMEAGEVYCGNHAKEFLFEKKYHVKSNKTKRLTIHYNPVEDVNDERFSQLRRKQYNICYIGRTNKPYFKNILKGVEAFSNIHKDNSVQFIIIGNLNQSADCISKIGQSKSNLTFFTPGDVYPIPRFLFKFCDVICAGSGSAIASVFEGVPVIIPDPDNCMANGVFGYDTMEPMLKNPNFKQLPFDEALESVLIRKDYLKKDFRLPKQKTSERCYDEFLADVISNWNNRLFYPQDELYKCNGFSFKSHVAVMLMNIFPFIYTLWQKTKNRKNTDEQ